MLQMVLVNFTDHLGFSIFFASWARCFVDMGPERTRWGTRKSALQHYMITSRLSAGKIKKPSWDQRDFLESFLWEVPNHPVTLDHDDWYRLTHGDDEGDPPGPEKPPFLRRRSWPSAPRYGELGYGKCPIYR